ncbi:MAG: hypothetical protein IT442_10360 [Phycisphaeraceae bacterium]|nr:hypothetical protein [Phycisphaeraceae bacterium]
MADISPELVRKIADEVLAALRQRGVEASSGGGGGGGTVEVHPPVGVCTGDYSKFPELAGKVTPATAPVTTTNVLTGIVTARQLQEAMNKSVDGVAVLAAGARLTPLANDLARQKPSKVRRAGEQGGGDLRSPAKQGDAAAGVVATNTFGGTWAWWVDDQCPVVGQVTTARKEHLRYIAVNRSPGAASAVEVVGRVVELIKGRKVSGAILFVSRPSRAVCLANRSPLLRAVQASHPQGLRDAIEDLSPNVLVIEHTRVKPEAMLEMVDVMMRSNPRPIAAVERALNELHGRR